MRVIVSLAAIFLYISVVIISCGKDHNDPPPSPPVIDTIPDTDTLPPPDTVDSLPDGWHIATTPSATADVADVFFTNNTTGYAITNGDGGVWKSTDGGLSWQVNGASFGSTPPALANLAVTPDDKVFIVVDHGLERSVSGAPFQKFYLNNVIQNNDVYFTSGDTGYVSGGSIHYPASQYCLWKTTDGGLSWQATGVQPAPYPNPSYGVYDFAFSATGNGYQTYGAKVLYKKRGDTAWQPSATPVPAPAKPFNSVAAPAADIAYAVTQNGVVYKSVNGGESFAKVGIIGVGVGGYLNLHFTSETTGYCTLSNGLVKTTDGGATWKFVFLWSKALIEVHFTDADHGWVCGLDGTILTYHP